MDPPVRYAANGDVYLAYRVLGDAPVDLVYVPGIWSNVEIMFDEPRWARYLERLASFSRLIVFDMRGIGLSDRGREPPLLELQVEDVGAVMDAVGSEEAVVFGGARGAAPALSYAAANPERTRSLVLYAPIVRTLRADDWPYGRTPEEQRHFFDRFIAEMGTAANLDLQGPSAAGDPAFRRWWARFERLVASPGAFRELAAIMSDLDVRDVVDAVQVPTVVLLPNRRPDREPRGRPVDRGTDPRRAVRPAGRRRPHPVPRRCRRDRRRGGGGRHRRPRGLPDRPRPGHDPVHRHRRVHGAGVGPRRPGME
jgi:pimeloyl-ACP methyl ester carboxylesterase